VCRRQRARTTISVSFKLFPNISSFHSLVNSNMRALISWKRKSKIYSFQMLDLDKCDIPHFHETLKINMSLMIANETVGSYLHRIIKGQNITNIVFIRHSFFHVYLGFDTLILASRFWHLVSLAYRGYDTLIPTPRFWHLVSSTHRGYNTLIPALRFWHLVSLAYRGYDTLIPTPRFWHLVSPTHRGYNTLIPALRFRHLVPLV